MDHSQAQHHHAQQQQQQQQQQQPRDVLAEARKNLQALIDSGLSRDMLHQLVDDGASLKLAMPFVNTNHSSHLQPPQQHTPLPSHPEASPSSSPLIPPAPQCAPPPIPQQHVQHHTQQQQLTPPDSHQHPMLSPIPSSSPVSDFIKTEAPVSDDTSGLFIYPPSAPAAHRARISVSSTSSASSGHASIWSAHSAASNMSWASGSTNSSRMQAPLPLPPQMTSPTGTPILGGPSMGGSLNKQNIYWCTSCETSFKRKYDWKRHEDEFHERWRKYPCPEPGCNRSFWGSNSFNQHHKQCHGCTTCPHAEKIVKFLRKRKYWACGFCSALHPARERHVEHVARHFESGMTKGEWMHSRVVYGLLHQPLIHEAWDALVASKQSEYGGRRPRFSWHPSRTGRAQGFLEKENPGQLQDLLEFFSGDEGDAQWIVSVAYDLADIVMDNAHTSPPHLNSMGPPQSFAHHDPRISFAPLPSSTPHNHQPHFGSTFQTPMFMPSQAFPSPRASPPDSISQPSMAPTQSPSIKQEHQLPQLPQLPQFAPLSDGLQPGRGTPGDSGSILSQTSTSSNNGNQAGDTMMDFECSSATTVFEDWDTTTGLVMDEFGTQSTSSTAHGNWGMMPYFGVPRVAS